MLVIRTSSHLINNIFVRAERLGYNLNEAEKIILVIGSFESVEKFQAWKSKQAGNLKYIVERIGANTYRKIRELVREWQ